MFAKNNNNSRNYLIDLLRFIAALMVVLFHLNQYVQPLNNWYRNSAKYGWLGVPVFFVISGFCIMLSAENTRNAGLFLKKRFFRIYPPYWGSLLIVLLAALLQKMFTGTNSVPNIPLRPMSVLTNISLFTYPSTPIPAINWVYWSLTCEVFFYMIIGIACIKKSITFPFILIVSLLAVSLPDQRTGPLFFLTYWPAFASGISIFYFFNSPSKTILFTVLPLVAVSLIALFRKQPLEYCIVILLTMGIIFVSNYIQLKKNFLTILGEHSYAVYLIHVPVGVFMFGSLKTMYIQQHLLANIIYDMTVYALISTIAWQYFIRIEKPFIEFGKKPFKRLYQFRKAYKP
ncbi:MAG: acyltransferase family protein [Mucilaginibacter sp.]